MTRSLLGYGVLAGAFYLTVGLVLAATREGFDLARHPLSLLALGDGGWMQRGNLVLSGLMVIAAAVGVARVLQAAAGARRAGVLLGVYGVALVASGIFPPDPMAGFPPGATAGGASLSGVLHLAFGGIGFLALAGTALVVGAWFAARRDPFAHVSRVAAAVILIGFIGGAALAEHAAGVAFLWVAVLCGWAWLAGASIRLYRAVPHPDPDRRAAEPA